MKKEFMFARVVDNLYSVLKPNIIAEAVGQVTGLPSGKTQ